MVVLDAIHHIQAQLGKIGAGRALELQGRQVRLLQLPRVNGKPSLMCKSRMDHFLKIPGNYGRTNSHISADQGSGDRCVLKLNKEANKKIKRRLPPWHRMPTSRLCKRTSIASGISQMHRVFPFCQNVCHILRDHHLFNFLRRSKISCPLQPVLEMHPLDTVDRTPFLKEEAGIGYCNITKCCTEVCPGRNSHNR